MRVMTRVPKPWRVGGVTAGPPDFDPAHGQPVNRLLPPGERDPSRWNRQRAVFCGVGGQFVQRQRDGLRRLLLQHQARPFDSHPRAVFAVAFGAVWRQFLERQVAQIGAGPARLRE